MEASKRSYDPNWDSQPFDFLDGEVKCPSNGNISSQALDNFMETSSHQLHGRRFNRHQMKPQRDHTTRIETLANHLDFSDRKWNATAMKTFHPKHLNAKLHLANFNFFNSGGTTWEPTSQRQPLLNRNKGNFTARMVIEATISAPRHLEDSETPSVDTGTTHGRYCRYWNHPR